MVGRAQRKCHVTSLDASYAACRLVASQAASSFPWTFRVLPPEKRRGMEALYAFARKTDDLGDSDAPLESKRLVLRQWRANFLAALTGDTQDSLLPAVADTKRSFGIPLQYLLEIIEGVERDLSPVRYATYADLRQYCYLVASAVGLACVHIWGFKSDAVLKPATECGVAFQMTNILRDLREDARMGRVYLPDEDLEQCGVTRDDLLGTCQPERLNDLLELEFHRTREAFAQAAETARYLSSDGQRIFPLMFDTYRSLFAALERQGSGILKRRVRLAWHVKLAIAARSLFR